MIDDDPNTRHWAQLHLATMGMDVEAAVDFESAKSMMGMRRTDLVVFAFHDDVSATTLDALEQMVRSAPTNPRALILLPPHAAHSVATLNHIEGATIIVGPISGLTLREAVSKSLESNTTEVATWARGSGEMTSSPATSTPAARSLGPLVESKHLSLLVISIRNLVTLSRSLRGNVLELLLKHYYEELRGIVALQAGWIARTEAMGLLCVFEDGPNGDRPHASRAIEAGLRSILMARQARQWAEQHLSNTHLPQLSVGAGVVTGDVLVTRFALDGVTAPNVAGASADVSARIDGLAKGIGWSLAATDASILLAGGRFQYGRRASMETADHRTVALAEVTGFNPGSAKPGELRFMAEVREAVLANSVLARVPGDADARTSELTVLIGPASPGNRHAFPTIPGKRVLRRLSGGTRVTAYRASNSSPERSECIKVIDSATCTPAFTQQYLSTYRDIARLDQRNTVSVFEVGTAGDLAFVAAEFLTGGTLATALRSPMPVGLALNYLAQMCLALDAMHDLGRTHGDLHPEHFMLREEGVLVLADFNVTAQIDRELHIDTQSGLPDRIPHMRDGTRQDFRAIGEIFLAMISPADDGAGTSGGSDSHLPFELTPLQRCLDGLLGTGQEAPFATGEEVIVELLGLREIFPFDVQTSNQGSHTWKSNESALSYR